MKRVFILIAGLILLVFLAYYSNNDKQDFYGTYIFEKVSYLSPLSSSTTDYINKQMSGTKYTIKADLFKIESPNNTLEVSSPKYVKEKIQKDLPILSDVHTLIGKEFRYQYTIYNKDGNTTHWRLYISSDNVWIASYVDNTANGSEIIMRMDKLSK